MSGELALLRLFRAAAESGSFREAAVRSGTSPQAVTRAVKALETHYGELLFHRNTRQVRITAFGEALLERVRPVLDQVDEVWRPPGKDSAATSGVVRISVPRSLGLRAVLPAARHVAEAHPGITLDIRLSDLISDAVDERIDIGIRVGFMPDNRVVARQVGQMRLHVVASPALVARCGLPEGIAALDHLPTIASLDVNTGRPWPWYFEGHRQFTPSSPAMVADDADMELGAVLAGLGFAQMADYMVAPYIRDGTLARVLPAAEPPAWGLYLYRPRRGPVPARVRAVFDELHTAIASLPSLTRPGSDRPKTLETDRS